MFPITCSFSVGVVVQIPTLPPAALIATTADESHCILNTPLLSIPVQYLRAPAIIHSI